MIQPFYQCGFFSVFGRYLGFFRDLTKYLGMKNAESFKLLNLRPCLTDQSTTTPVDSCYFYQDTWVFEKIFKNHPSFHVDVGSSALLIGVLSKITHILSIDIRPLPVSLEGLECIQGDILKLPFSDGELFSLSSLCVLEHVGLGRYGDRLDPLGTYKAVQELSRVVGKEGNLYVSVPIGEEDALYFNGYRMFKPDGFISLFKDFKLADTLFILEDRMCTLDEYKELDKNPYKNKMIVGCFHFQKTA